MANEIRACYVTGKTLSARLMLSGAVVGAPVALTESVQVPGYYTGSIPANTPSGLYDVVLLEGTTVLDAGLVRWNQAGQQLVVPGPPAEAALCRVYGYTETLDNRKVANAQVKFRLVTANGVPVASERLISEREVTVVTDSEGRIVGADGNPWVDLQRNDVLLPEGTSYEVSSRALGINGRRVTLAAETADLRTLLLA